MTTLFELPQRPEVPIEGTDQRFPVGRLFCIGRNYEAHAREMGKDPDREPPFYFTKFPDTVVIGDSTIPYPPASEDYQFEIELVAAIGKEAVNVSVEDALSHVYGYAVGLDMTRRDLQMAARAAGRPWDAGKNFAYAAPIAAIRPVASGGHVESGPIRLTVNGKTRQEADIQDLIWDVAETIFHLSRMEKLLPGDLIYTGTPAGVGPVVTGDVMEATIGDLEPLRVTIGEQEHPSA